MTSVKQMINLQQLLYISNGFRGSSRREMNEKLGKLLEEKSLDGRWSN